MAETTVETMRRLIPACAAETDGVLEAWIADAVERMNRLAWGTALAKGAVYLAGHLYLRSRATLTQTGGGAVSSESAGGMSRGYAAVPGWLSDAGLLTTGPGVEFVTLRNEACGPFVGIDVLDTTGAP